MVKVCGEIPMSGPLRTVLGGVRENPEVIPLKSVPQDPHIIHNSLADLSPIRNGISIG